MPWFGTLLAALFLAILLYAGARPIGPIPPLGNFLDPVHGVWAVAAAAELPSASSARIPGLLRPVRVRYDRRGVPHIFAESETDVQRALGYVVARDRLFQLELQARAGAGTLTELIGPDVLSIDRAARGLGLPGAAERALAALDSTSAERTSLNAFADGVNAWIDQLSARQVPLEYRLLDRRPARWQPINTLHLLNRMGWTLALSGNEVLRLETRARVGRAAADALFPIDNPIQEPLQPNGQTAPRFDFIKVPPPGPPDTQFVEREKSSIRQSSLMPRAEDALGSNNWAVSPARSASGFALLAGDPHLELTLPSIWYEAHLIVPGKLDVYGVTIPGAPSIVIGFNRALAWTFTNTESDVMDKYAESVDEDARPNKYLLDGAWVPMTRRVETYRGKGGEVLAVDTLLFNRRGPINRSGGRWISTRWTVLEGASSLRAFAAVAHAGSVADYFKAMETYGAPPQNMLVADRAGSIGIRSTGRFPVRPGDGRGDEFRDGTTSASDWTGDWSWSAVPQSVDPRQGFLASANQQPIDPRQHPRYLGADWYSPWRAMRINLLLRADSQVSVDDMRRFQTDPGSARADLFVPAFLAAAGLSHDSSVGRAAALLAQWDRRYLRENQRAVLFEGAMQALSRRLWDELTDPVGNPRSWQGPYPGESVVAELLADPDNAWWDDRRTSVVEHRDDVLNAALQEALQVTVAIHGEPDAGGWRWDRVRHANIYHLLRIPALSRLELPVQGGPSTLSPSSGSGTEGPSWRMVVQLGPNVHGWGTYPGGQSGNPVSHRYAEHLQQWMAGELDSLRFPSRIEELTGEDASASLLLEPAR